MSIILYVFTIVTSAAAGGLFYRMRGGAPSLPRPVEQALFCLVFLVVLLAMGVPAGAALLAYGMAVAAVLTGHGQYFPEVQIKAIAPERLDFLLRPFFGADPRTDRAFAHLHGRPPEDLSWDGVRPSLPLACALYGLRRLAVRCAAGMALTGGVVTLAPGLALAWDGQWIAAALIGMSGFILKPLAYQVTHRLGAGTEGAEYAYGALQWAALAVWLAPVYGLG